MMMITVSMSPPTRSVPLIGSLAACYFLSRALSVSATLSTLSLTFALPRSTLPSFLRIRSWVSLPAASFRRPLPSSTCLSDMEIAPWFEFGFSVDSARCDGGVTALVLPVRNGSGGAAPARPTGDRPLSYGARSRGALVSAPGLAADARQEREDDQHRTGSAPDEFGQAVGGEDAECSVAVGKRDHADRRERHADDQ